MKGKARWMCKKFWDSGPFLCPLICRSPWDRYLQIILYDIGVVHVPIIHLSARSSFFHAFFLHFYGKPFYGSPDTSWATLYAENERWRGHGLHWKTTWVSSCKSFSTNWTHDSGCQSDADWKKKPKLETKTMMIWGFTSIVLYSWFMILKKNFWFWISQKWNFQLHQLNASHSIFILFDQI